MTRRWTILCLLLTLILISSQVSTVVTGTPALADNGNGNGNGKDKDKDKDKKDKDDKDKEKEKDKGNGNNVVEPAEPYWVDVSCDPDEAAGQTACTFTGMAPAGGKQVGHVDLPATEVCATVLGGDAEYVDPDPNTGVVGYKSKGSTGAFTLVLEGTVTTGRTATYWIKAGNGVFPATGPGLICAVEAPPAEVAPTAIVVTGTLGSPATEEAAASGAVGVHTYTCPAGATPAETDWFSACEPGATGVRFTLTSTNSSDPELVGEGTTQPNGEIRFDGLVPGAYALDAPDAVWCHAESDSVNEHGDLVVAAGAEVFVWIFLCGAEAATAP